MERALRVQREFQLSLLRWYSFVRLEFRGRVRESAYPYFLSAWRGKSASPNELTSHATETTYDNYYRQSKKERSITAETQRAGDHLAPRPPCHCADWLPDQFFEIRFGPFYVFDLLGTGDLALNRDGARVAELFEPLSHLGEVHFSLPDRNFPTQLLGIGRE
jgi:hypothetical protein